MRARSALIWTDIWRGRQSSHAWPAHQMGMLGFAQPVASLVMMAMRYYFEFLIINSYSFLIDYFLHRYCLNICNHEWANIAKMLMLSIVSELSLSYLYICNHQIFTTDTMTNIWITSLHRRGGGCMRLGLPLFSWSWPYWWSWTYNVVHPGVGGFAHYPSVSADTSISMNLL